MLKLQVRHKTQYKYSSPVQLNEHRIFLYPRAGSMMRVSDYHLNCNLPCRIQWGRDVFENAFAVIFFSQPTESLEVDVHADVQLLDHNPFDFSLEQRAQRYPFAYRADERAALSPYLQAGASADARNVLSWLYRCFPSMPEFTMDVLTQLNQRIFSSLTYLPRDEEGVQTPDETLLKMEGSCRDYAWLFIHTCRQMGIAARFVSGYHYSPSSGGGHRADNSTHAWAEVYLPGAGWKGFDPTNGLMTDANFIPCAVGSEPHWISPVQGTFGSGGGGVKSDLLIELSIVEI